MADFKLTSVTVPRYKLVLNDLTARECKMLFHLGNHHAKVASTIVFDDKTFVFSEMNALLEKFYYYCHVVNMGKSTSPDEEEES